MPFDAFGNYIPDDEAMSLDAMQYELAKKGSMPLRPSGSDVPYLASEVPSLRVPVTPKEPPKPYSTATNLPQAVADRLGISALPQALMAIATDFPAAVASELGYKDTAKAIRYEPTSRIANQMLEVAEQAPRVITGSHMGFGPLAETWTTPIRGISPEDVRVMGKRAIETGRELRAIPEDFANAQSGVVRQNYMGEPTYGAKLQSVADDIGDVLARQQARRSGYETSPRSSVEVFGDMVPDTKMYAVRNTGEGQMLRPTTSKGGVEPRNVDYGDTEQFLSELAPPLSVNKPEEIIDVYENLYMSANTPAIRRLNTDWEKFQADKVTEMYPSHFTRADSFKAFRTGYPANVIQDMKLKWLHEYVEQKKAEGFDIPSMDEYFARAQAAQTLTKKIAPNLIQKYIGTPDDPFLKSALQGITMNPADELVEQFLTPQGSLQTTRREADFEAMGEVGGKLMPVAESKLAAQNAELDKLIADQVVVGRVEGMVVPYPDGRIDPDTGEVMLATNPNYAQYSNKIGAMRKAIEDTEEEIRKLKIAQSYENVSDASIKMKTATEFRNRIPPEEQQFFPALFNEKEKRTSISPTEYVTPDDALLFQTSAEGLKRAGILPLTKTLVEKIMSGEIPPDQVPNLAQPQTITKFMKNIVAPRIEKEKAARLAMKDYKVNVEKHFLEVLKTIPDSMKVGTNAKLLWIDDTTPEAEINQHLSDETFVLDHCIGNSGHGGGLKNLFTGDERGYIPYLDPATKQKFKNASGTSSYMDAVLQGEKDIMMIRDDTTGMPVGTIELDREVGKDGDIEYRIGYVSGYKNHNNKFKGIDPKYREALRDSLNMVKDSVVNTGDNEVQSGVYDMLESNQVERMKGKLEIPGSSSNQRAEAWEAIKKNIMDTLDGDRYITIDQAEQAVKEYKQANPPVPAVRSGFPPAGKDITERNIVMQGLSRENLDTTRQFNAARIVGNGDRFQELPMANSSMDPRPYQAYRGILQSENRRADPIRGVSDYELFRNLQNYVDQIDNGDLRFGDFNLNGASELLDLREGLQKHADAIGQLAHYADVLQRNGYRSPLPSEQTGAPEWQTYQRYIGELGIDNPSDLRTRLLDTINHGDLREIDPQLDEIQRVNLRHLLEIHERAVKQAMDYPAPTAPTQQRGIPLRDYETLTQNTMAQIGADFGDGTRQEVGRIMADAIAYQMDVPANERPVQLSNYLTSQAREAANPVAVRNALRVMAGALDQANADIQNARNAPAPTTALPTVTQYGEAVDAGRQTMSPYQWADVEEILNNIQNEINREGGLYYQHPARIITRLNEQAQLQDVGGEPDTAQGLRNLAGQMARLVPANPPASMALANQNAQQRNPTRQLVAGQEVLSNSIIDALNDIPFFAPVISDRLNALQWRENLVDDPAGLMRNIRIEADAEANAGNEQLASIFYDIANLIADERGETLFTPAGRELQAPTESSLDIAMTTEGQRNTNRVEQVVALREGIDRQLEEISDSSRGALLSLIDFYRNPNQLPDSITDHTNRYDDAVRIADYLRRHAQARLDAMPQERAIPTATMPTPRDVAMSIAPDSTHQSLVQRQRQVELLTEGINDQIRSLPTTDEPALREALEFYRDYDNLPTAMMSRIPSEEDAERVLSHIRQHIENRIASLPENRGQGRQVERDGFFNRLNHVIEDTVLTAQNNPTYANMQDMPTVLEREINSYYQNSENLPQFIQYLRDDAASVETNVLGDEWHQNYVTEIRHLIDRLERLQRDMPQMAMSLTFHQEAEPAQLPAPAQVDNGNNFEQMRRINDVMTQRGLLVNQNHLGISQQFDSIVQAAINEFNPSIDTVNFINSIHQRANSVDRVGDREAQILANQLRHLAADVNEELTRQAQALPAPAPNTYDAYVQRGYEAVSQEIRNLHSYMIDDVQRNPLTRANLIDVIRNDLDRYGLSGSSPQAIEGILARIRNDGIAPAIDPVAQHYNRVEQGVNQPQGLGALDRNDSDLVRLLTTDFLNGDRNALTQLSPVQREMAEVLTRSREVEPTVINELDHRRLINTLVSQTYNPATDGEALIRLAETRSGMFAGLDEAQQAQVVDIVNKWNFLRFPRYRPPEEGMGLEPEGRKRGGFIRKRKMNEGGTPPKLTPYEQFKIDNAERIRQGQEDIANRNKYDPYKGTDRPIPTQRGASGSAGTTGGAGPSNLIRPRVYAIGGKAYMEIGGQVKPVPNVPATPEKTRPNTTDYTTRKPVDPGFAEVLERVRNAPKPSGSAGTNTSGAGPSSLNRPRLYAGGGRIHMSEGGAPDLSMYAPRIQELVRTGQIPLSDASWMNEYAKTKGDPRAETSKGMHKDLSEKYQNFYDRIRSGEIPDPYKATPKATASPKGGSGGGGGGGMDTNLSRPYERNLPYKDGGNVNIDAMRLALMKG